MSASVRSLFSVGLTAGLVTAAAGAAVLAPVTTPTVVMAASPAVQLSAIASTLPLPAAAAPTPPGPVVIAPSTTPGERLINSYDAIQPWAQYGVELSAWAVSWLPWPVGLLGPQMNIGYSGIEPVTRALVYSLAYALDGQWDLIGPTLTNGVKTGTNNFVQGEINWVLSFFPPLPPIGAGATVTSAPQSATPARAAATATTTVPETVPAEQTSTQSPAPVPTASPAVTPPAQVSASTARNVRAATRAPRSATAAPAAAAAVAVDTPTLTGVETAPDSAPAPSTPTATKSTASRGQQASRGAAKDSSGSRANRGSR